MRLTFIILLWICVACGCDQRPDGKQLETYLSGEVTRRLGVLAHSTLADSVKEIALQINSRVNELILLSKDTENKTASVNLSASYFNTLAMQLKIPGNEFISISGRMSADEISTNLLQNELTALNRLTFMNNIGDITPGAAR